MAYALVGIIHCLPAAYTFHARHSIGHPVCTGHPDHVSIYHKFNSSSWSSVPVPSPTHDIGEFDYVCNLVSLSEGVTRVYVFKYMYL